MQNRYSCVLYTRYKQLKKIAYYPGQPHTANNRMLQDPRSKGITANRLSYFRDTLYTYLCSMH